MDNKLLKTQIKLDRLLGIIDRWKHKKKLTLAFREGFLKAYEERKNDQNKQQKDCR